eukprot:CAMPEP_0185267574 /NCGR_PEP_ID=MMETSP1359-20130426/34741_1 /TAXON_ID=552665 /ORGANISM="Bigelowiella longifila, Strain CCMP242" /LENGTH=114 /DNA_ID=CAMNT_0027857981 /DNA_START=477 /DNA_END=821 /DNA_ORIENTATION=-
MGPKHVLEVAEPLHPPDPNRNVAGADEESGEQHTGKKTDGKIYQGLPDVGLCCRYEKAERGRELYRQHQQDPILEEGSSAGIQIGQPVCDDDEESGIEPVLSHISHLLCHEVGG